jgi:hypothetical protein
MRSNFDDLSGHVHQRKSFHQVGVGILFVLVLEVPLQHVQVEILKFGRFGLIFNIDTICNENVKLIDLNY